jgi:CDP-glycerol glycerophosphotransferase
MLVLAGADPAGVPRISVVVPIYDVEAYLPDCLRSLAAQTARDLEFVLVDDGSTDKSAEIAAEFVARDERFRLIVQPNAGLGAARNAGVRRATGELLAFADSDDVVPPEAYERLAASLDRTGSDFAAGNVLRLEGDRTRQAPWLAEAFARTRLKTHVRRCRPLLADRTAWNKLFRRDFWDRNQLRFPEGVLHEDIPVMLPAHVTARSVDVLAEPVYHWRIRGDGDSITQKRLEIRVLRDRLAAVEQVRAYLAEHGSRRLRRWYDQRLVRDDLRLHLDLLADAEPAYRTLFLDHVTALLDGASRRLFADLPAIDRLKWHLALHGRTRDLLEVLRFARDQRATTPPLRRAGRWYGDYPFLGDRDIPRSVFRLGHRDAELSLRATVEQLVCEDDRLVVRGHAHLAGLGVTRPGDQRVQLMAFRRGRGQRLRMRAGGIRVVARPVERPDLEPHRRWSGFEVTLPPRAIDGTGTWQLGLFVRAHGLRRRYLRFDHEQLAAAELPAPQGLAARAVPCTSGRLEVRVRDRWATLRAARIVDGDLLELSGEQRLGETTRLQVRRACDGWCTELPLGADGPFTARVPLSLLHQAPRRPDAHVEWQLSALDGSRRFPLALPSAAPLLCWWTSGRELVLARTQGGDAAIADRAARPVVTAAGWAGAHRLALDVRLASGLVERELVLMDWHRNRVHVVPLLHAEDEGVYRALVTPRPGEWRFYGRPAGEEALPAMARVALDDTLTLPLITMIEDQLATLEAGPDGSLLLSVPGRSAERAPRRGARGPARASASAAARGG